MLDLINDTKAVPRQMQAVRFHELGGPEVLVLEEVPVPSPGDDDLLVRVRTTSVNHKDIWMRKGHPHPAYAVTFPAIVGIDLCADVVEIGANVEGFVAGDRITISPYIPCRKCENCRRARPQYCTRLAVYSGTYAEYTVLPAALALHVASHVPDEQVGCFSNNYITAWQMLMGKAQVSADDVVFVWAGASGLGSAGMEIARLAGATVIASAGGQHKRARLAELGADFVVDHYEEDVVARVREFTDGRGVDIVFEHVGQDTWERSIALCAEGGAIVTAGATSGDDARMNITAMFAKQVRILGSRLGTMDDALSAIRHLEAGRLKPLIDEVVPLERLADAHRMVESHSVVGKVAVRVAEE